MALTFLPFCARTLCFLCLFMSASKRFGAESIFLVAGVIGTTPAICAKMPVAPSGMPESNRTFRCLYLYCSFLS